MKGILLKYNDYTYKISVASAASIVVGLNGIRNLNVIYKQVLSTRKETASFSG